MDSRIFHSALLRERGAGQITLASLLASTGEASMLLSAMNAALWTVMPLATPRDLHAMGLASQRLRSLMSPAEERAAHVCAKARALQELPFGYDFRLRTLGMDALKEALAVLRPMRPLRRRELVARDAGFAPTEEESWCFRSKSELFELVAAGRLACKAVRQGSPSGSIPVLLLAATLRPDKETLGEALCTLPVAAEWTDGPAADPLQLGLQLKLSTATGADADLEFVSGGWSEWAETWSFQDETLEATLAIAVQLPEGGNALLVWRNGNACHEYDGHPCNSTIAKVVKALNEAHAGLRAVVCLAEVKWNKAPPPWCPQEIQQLDASA